MAFELGRTLVDSDATLQAEFIVFQKFQFR
jgi:hypothetical protein